MTRIKKRLLLGMTLLVLGTAGWFYYAFFVSTDAAMRRAEAFLFRRMRVAQLEEAGSYRFFYVTNRRAEAGQERIDERFGRERGEALHFGFFDTRIKPTLGLGMIIDPTDWFQNEEIRLLKVEEQDKAAFVEQTRRFVQNSRQRSLLVVVHGFREAFPSALRKTAFVGHILDLNSPVLLFDWPGNQGSSLSGYRRAREVAQASGAELAATLQLIVKEIQPDRLWLVANSMGAQVVANAFSLLYQDPDMADSEVEIEDVVLTAPDVDSNEFDNQFKKEINALARQLTVYVSSNDRALLMSRIVNRGRRTGESTLDPSQLDEAARVVELIDPESDLVTLVDVTPINRTRNFHNFSLETPEFFDDLYLRLTNPDMPRSRLLYQARTQEGTVYWVLTRGR